MAAEEQVARLGQVKTPTKPEPVRPPLRSRLGSWLLGILLALICATMFTPGLTSQQIPVSDDMVGQPAPSNFKANRDYEIEDLDTTRMKQEEAIGQVRAVYDHDSSLGEAISGRLREAFKLMREVVAAAAKPEIAPDSMPEPPPRGPPGGTASSEIERARTGELRRAVNERKGEFIKLLQVVPDEEEFKALFDARFSLDVENALTSLILPAMTGLLVADKKLLETEVDRGLTVLRFRGGQKIEEESVEDVGLIKDVHEARTYIQSRTKEALKDYHPSVAKAVVTLASRLVQPNLSFNRLETERRKEDARANVKTVIVPIKKGEMIVREGDRLEKRHLMILKAIQSATESTNKTHIFAGTFILTLLFLGALVVFARATIRKFKHSFRDLLFMTVWAAALLMLSYLLTGAAAALHDRIPEVPITTWLYMIPIAAGAMLVRVVLNSETAIFFSMAVSGLFGLQLEGNLAMALYALIGSLIAAFGVGHFMKRSIIIRAGAMVAGANVVTVIGFALYSGTANWHDLSYNIIGALVGGLIFISMLVSTATMVVEDLFGYNTNVKLLELANLNHPLLRELVMEAPGTYHHSLMVGSLAEAGAEAIGANPLLTRVMAYYHDIGKSKNPDYFGENQRGGANRHKSLSPSMSVSVIRRHVEDGLKMAKAHKLPQPILDAIVQHHGTTLIAYFHNLAAQSAHSGEPPPSEVDFRYEGMKPQTREAALVMIADHCEAAAKSLPDPTPARLQGLVQKMINKLFTDGQFDECDITLKALHRIAGAYIRILTGIYHTRPQYQEPASKDKTEKVADEQPRAAASRGGSGVVPFPFGNSVATIGHGAHLDNAFSSPGNLLDEDTEDGDDNS